MSEYAAELEKHDSVKQANSGDELPDLSCPTCGSDLAWDDLFLSHRVCSTCRRHFFISPRERLSLIGQQGEFAPTNQDISSFSPVEIEEPGGHAPSSAQRLANTRERDLINDAIVTGIGKVGSEDAVLVLLDEHATGTTIGALTTEKIVLAMELAATRQLPLLMFVAGGNAPTSSGPLSLVQPTRIAAASAQLHLAGIPTIAVICQSASSELVGTLAGQCDVVIAEPGTRVWDRRIQMSEQIAGPMAVESMRDNGLLDDVIERDVLLDYLSNVLEVFGQRGMSRTATRTSANPPSSAPARELRSNQRDHPRPAAAAFLEHLVVSRFDIRGDRAESDSESVRAGFGRLNGQTIAFATFDRVAPDMNSDSSSVRKLIRIVSLSSRLDVPLLILVGNDRTVTTSSAEAMAIAKLSGVLTVAPVPVIVAIVGEVRSSLARALVSADRVLCQVNAVFGVDGTPPGPGRLPGAGWNRVTASEALHLGLIEEIVPESGGVGESTIAESSQLLQDAISGALATLGAIGSRRRVADRQQKIRSLGQSTPAGKAALRDELLEYRDWQKNLAKSVEDWRDKWDQLRSGQPRFNFQRPDLGDLATRLRARRTELLERAGLNDRNAR